MLSKTVTYKDFNNQEITEEVYFNLTEAEIVELNIREDLKAIGQSGNANKIMDTFKRLLKAAYGVRINGGAKFVKPDSAWDEFVSSEAYSQIFMEMVTNQAYAAEFINQLIPAALAQRNAEQQHQANLTPSEAARARSEANMQGHQQPAQQPVTQAQPFQAPIPPHESYQQRQAEFVEQQGPIDGLRPRTEPQQPQYVQPVQVQEPDQGYQQ